jgi:hypothetical protein
VFGDQRLNVHGPDTNVGELVAGDPVRPGSSDFCLEWPGPIEQAVDHLRSQGIELHAGPLTRTGARGEGQSVYFRDPEALGDRARVESAATPLMQPGTYLEPFALRGLGWCVRIELLWSRRPPGSMRSAFKGMRRRPARSSLRLKSFGSGPNP